MTSTAHPHHHTEHVDLAAENKKHFDANAREVDAKPELQELARQVGAAILRTHESLFNSSSTKMMDFACGTGMSSNG